MTASSILPAFIKITFTKPQAEWVDWALTGPIAEWDDPEQLVYDHDCTLEVATKGIADKNRTRLDGVVLTLPADVDPNGEFIGDLLGMLEGLGVDLAEESIEYARGEGQIRAAHAIAVKKAECAMNAAARIRRVLGVAKD